MKLSKIQIIVGVVLIILITLLFSLMTKTQRKIEESKIVALSQVKKENEVTLESILKKHNVQFISVEGIKIYVRFDRKLYNEDGTSNENFFKVLVQELVDYKQSTFYLIDEKNNIEIKVFFNESDKSYTTNINNKPDFYEDTDGEIYSAIDHVKIARNSNIYTVEESVDMIAANTLKFDKFVKYLGEPEGPNEDGYYLFDDGNIAVIKYPGEDRIRNMVYSAKYVNRFVSEIDKDYSLNKVAEIYGTAPFGSVEEGYLGYRNNDYYIFFYDNEISLHGYDYTAQLKFEKALEEYIIDKDLYKLYRAVKILWPRYYEAEYNEENQTLYMLYPAKGVEINLGYEDMKGITFYSNYYFTDAIKEKIQNGYFNLNADEDLIHIMEKRRVNN